MRATGGSRHLRITLAAATTSLLLLAACTGSDRRASSDTTGTTTTRASVATTTATPPRSGSSTRKPRAAKSYDPLLHDTLASIRAFWRRTLPAVYGSDYEDLTGGIYAYSKGSAIPPCGGVSMPYVFVQQNAFYCPDDDYIAWDDEGLFPRLAERYRPFLLSVVLAHEWGHAIQARVDAPWSGGEIGAEQQADCFAGAWAADLSAPGRPASTRRLATQRDRDLDDVLAGLVAFRDRLGITADDLGAHGTAFDRIRAFQDGWEGGAEVCASYEDELPELVAVPFRSFKERFRGGNMPFDELLPELAVEIPAWFRTNDPTAPTALAPDAADLLCLGDVTLPAGVPDASVAPQVRWCADDGLVHYDPASLRRLYERNGDFGVATVLALVWSAVAERGLPPATAADRGRAICRVGAWTGSLYDPAHPETSVLSPGDADEAVRVLLEVADDPAVGTAFERVAAFRRGVLGGLDACGSSGAQPVLSDPASAGAVSNDSVS